MESKGTTNQTAISELSPAEWNTIRNAYMRGIDWFVCRRGSRWTISLPGFERFPLYRTKTAAYDAAEVVILAESHNRRGQ